MMGFAQVLMPEIHHSCQFSILFLLDLSQQVCLSRTLSLFEIRWGWHLAINFLHSFDVSVLEGDDGLRWFDGQLGFVRYSIEDLLVELGLHILQLRYNFVNVPPYCPWI